VLPDVGGGAAAGGRAHDVERVGERVAQGVVVFGVFQHDGGAVGDPLMR